MRKRDLGILFIHGIGEQEEGETLIEFGQPLLEWIRDWIEGGYPSDRPRPRDSPHIEVVDSSLSASEIDDFIPAHATVRLRPLAYKEDEVDWVLAEAWWAGLVQPPTFSQIAGWMLTIGSWVILLHVTKPVFLPEEGKQAGWARQGLALAVWLLFTILVQLLVVILSILAIIPVPQLRSALSRVLLFLTVFLGDSYVLTRSDFQRSAIVARTRQSLAWLCRECENVAIVAHSQGSAVAHLALRDEMLGIRGAEGTAFAKEVREKIRLLVTFGSGLSKLEMLTQLARAPRKARFVARAVPLIMLAVFLAGYGVVYRGSHEILEYAAVIMILVVVGLLALVRSEAKDHWTRFRDTCDTLSLSSQWPNLHWCDLWATDDPVPNGPLVTDDKLIQGLTSHSVLNLRSFFKDHTSYLTNRADFIRQVVFEIDRVVKLWWIFNWPSDEFDRMKKHHKQHVSWLVISKRVTLLSVVLIFALFFPQLEALGSSISVWATELLPESLVKLLGLVPAGLRVLVPFFSLSTVGYVLTGAAIPVLGVLGYWYLYGFVWRWWERGTTDRPLRRLPDLGRWATVTADSTAIVLGCGTPLIVLAFKFRLLQGLTLDQVLVVSVQSMLLVLIAMMAFGLFSSESAPPATGSRTRVPPFGVVLKRLLLLAFFVALVPFAYAEYIPFLVNYQSSAMLWIIGAIILGSAAEKQTVDAAVRKWNLSSAVRNLALTAPFVAALLAIASAFVRFGLDYSMLEVIKIGAIAYGLFTILVQGTATVMSRSGKPGTGAESANGNGDQ